MKATAIRIVTLSMAYAIVMTTFIATHWYHEHGYDTLLGRTAPIRDPYFDVTLEKATPKPLPILGLSAPSFIWGVVLLSILAAIFSRLPASARTRRTTRMILAAALFAMPQLGTPITAILTSSTTGALCSLGLPTPDRPAKR